MHLLFAAALPTWAIVLIVIAALLVVGAVMYVVFRWGMKNNTVARLSLSGASAVFSVLESVFKDNPDELDAHDFMKALDYLAKAGLDSLKEKEQGLSFDELKDNMRSRIKEIIGSFPHMSEQVSDDIIEKAVNAFFLVVGYIPKVSDVVKK